MKKSESRNRKGSVSVEVFKDTLRLRWTFKAQRYCLSLGFQNSLMGQSKARELASRIELDMMAGYFDPTLEKYGKVLREKTTHQTHTKPLPSAVKHLKTLLENYSQWMTETDPKINYHQWTRSYLVKKGATFETLVDIFKKDKTSSQYSWKFRKAIILKFICTLPEEFYSALKKEFQVTKYPGKDIGKTKHITRQPFNDKEIKQILNYTEDNYPQYSLMIELWILTGLRNGEIFSLRPQDFKDDFSKLIVSESVTKNQVGGGLIRKGTKTDRIRTLKLRGEICDRLKSRCKNLRNSELIFKSPKGYPIHCNNFRRRVWSKILTAIGITYRVPYACRHTMASRALESGLNPVAVASLLGHSSPTLVLERYGHVISADELPELPDR